MSKQDKPPFRGDKPKSGEKKPLKPDDKSAPSPEKTEAAPVLISGRIAKVLARVGIASRREVERMIEEGRVKLNGKILESPAINVSETDNIEVDDKPIASVERTRLWLYYKPTGLVTTNNDPEGRATVFEKLPEELPRVMSVGRLDINTEGLLLLTNDGGLARTLELPSTGWLRRYRVRAHGSIKQAQLDELKDGIAVEGVLYGSIEATLDRVQGSNVWITMGLREGKNREIKVVLGALGLDVNRLIRLSYGPFQLAELGEGKVVEVKGRMLRDQLGPRLTEESGANFDAPLREHEVKEEREKAAEWKPRRKITEVERKERARDRLSTRPNGFEDRSKRGKFDKDEPQEPEKPKYRGPRDRSANVWMGKGARPTVEKKEDVSDHGREPAKGNWHRSKDKLDPQKTFRSKKGGDAKGGAGASRGEPAKGDSYKGAPSKSASSKSASSRPAPTRNAPSKDGPSRDGKPFKSKVKKGPNADRRR